MTAVLFAAWGAAACLLGLAIGLCIRIADAAQQGCHPTAAPQPAVVPDYIPQEWYA